MPLVPMAVTVPVVVPHTVETEGEEEEVAEVKRASLIYPRWHSRDSKDDGLMSSGLRHYWPDQCLARKEGCLFSHHYQRHLGHILVGVHF